MTENKTPVEPGDPQIIHKSRRFNSVWFVPLVAALIGGWLAVKHFTEAGIPIQISFRTASGIEAGKTKIKFRDIQIGIVDSVGIVEDTKHVMVKVTVDREAKPYLRENTDFWVVQPRVGPGGISGLGTIISGAYINMRLGDGKPTRRFTGLEEPAVASADIKGVRLVLKADELGSLDRGVPIYFRDVRVGEVETADLAKDGSEVEVHALVEAPYDNFVRTSSHFWNVSGVSVSLGADGLNVDTESLVSILAGGLAFDSPSGQGEQAKNGSVFKIHSDYRKATQHPHPERGPFYALFPAGPTRGLQVGAVVSLEGTPIGEVTNLLMEYAPEFGVRTQVQIRIEPTNVHGVHPDDAKEVSSMISNLVKLGLRAQLKTGSLLTGALYVDLSMHPDEPVRLVGGSDLPELPTMPTTLESVEQKLDSMGQKAEQFLDHLAAMPIEGLIADSRGAVNSLHELLKDMGGKVDSLVNDVNGVRAQAEMTLAAATKAIGAIEAGIAPDSTLYYDLATTLEELSDAARSIRVLTAYLERHPNALIMGKSKSGGGE